MLNGLFTLCLLSLSFIFKGSKLIESLIVFFSKGVVSTLIDTYGVANKRVVYPVRPFPEIFRRAKGTGTSVPFDGSIFFQGMDDD
jgi:hypothetical protein